MDIDLRLVKKLRRIDTNAHESDAGFENDESQ